MWIILALVLCFLRGGLRPRLQEVGGWLVGVGAVASLALLVRHGWSVDIGTAYLVVAASVLVTFVGWVVVKAVFSSGRSAAAAALAAGALALGVAGLAYAASLGSGAIAADDVPLPLVALAMLAPGVATVMLASRLPRHELREEWDDEQWLRRFRGGLRARLVPAATARGHVAEVEQTLAAGGTSASSEFGHPLTLAHEVARADRTARRRRWAVSTSAAAGVPVWIAALAAAGQSWGTLTVPVVAILVVTAVGGLVVGWGRRPWRTGR